MRHWIPGDFQDAAVANVSPNSEYRCNANFIALGDNILLRLCAEMYLDPVS